jgi:hypothetical protein
MPTALIHHSDQGDVTEYILTTTLEFGDRITEFGEGGGVMRDATGIVKEQNIIDLNIPMQCLLVLLEKVVWKQGKALRSEEGKRDGVDGAGTVLGLPFDIGVGMAA